MRFGVQWETQNDTLNIANFFCTHRCLPAGHQEKSQNISFTQAKAKGS